MAVFRVEKNKDYTVISNYHLKDKSLSLKAKGLLSVIISLPENWDYSVDGLVSICGEGVTVVKSALLELKTQGYLQVIKHMPNETKSGRIEYEYIIYEQKQAIEKQDIENLHLENLHIENQPQSNTNIQNTYNKEKDREKEMKAQIVEVISFLNKITGRSYRVTSKGIIEAVRARLNDGYTVDDFKTVIQKKWNEWHGTNMEMYVRPDTLFRPSNFEEYLNQPDIIYRGAYSDRKGQAQSQPTPSYYGGAPRAERNFDERQYEPTDFKGLSVNIDDLDPNDV